MTCPTTLQGAIIDVGESANVTATLYDATGETLAKAALISLTLTLLNKADGAVINSRNAQDILDANGGTVATDGTLTLRLEPADNINVGGVAVGQYETHLARLTWSWDDGVATRTGVHEYEICVRPLTVPVP